MTILDEIIEAKRTEVAGLDAVAIHRRLAAAPAARPFAAALVAAPAPAVIAEFKRSSPSRGDIRPGADPAAIGRSYARAGAAALSVLTDAQYFSGALSDLAAVRSACDLPILRKDFIIDPLQIAEARSAGADAVLLIVRALATDDLSQLLDVVRQHGMEALVEVHDEDDADRAVSVGADLIGVNNRDLATFETDPAVTIRLLPKLDGRTVVSESGISEPGAIAELSAAGVDAFLVGEALMQAPDPGAELQRLRGTR